MEKPGQIPTENYNSIATACRDTVREAKSQFELELTRDVKNYMKKVLWLCKQQPETEWNNIGLLLNRRDELVSNNDEKAELLNTSFTSIFTSTVGFQALGRKVQADTTRLIRQPLRNASLHFQTVFSTVVTLQKLDQNAKRKATNKPFLPTDTV